MIVDYDITNVIHALIDMRKYKTSHQDLSNYYGTKATLLLAEFGLADVGAVHMARSYRAQIVLINSLLDKIQQLPTSYWGGWMEYSPVDDAEMAIHNKYRQQFDDDVCGARITLINSVRELLIHLFPTVADKKVSHDTLVANGLSEIAPDPGKYW